LPSQPIELIHRAREMELRVRPASCFTAAALEREPTGREGSQSQPEVSDTLKMGTYSLEHAAKQPNMARKEP